MRSRCSLASECAEDDDDKRPAPSESDEQTLHELPPEQAQRARARIRGKQARPASYQPGESENLPATEFSGDAAGAQPSGAAEQHSLTDSEAADRPLLVAASYDSDDGRKGPSPARARPAAKAGGVRVSAPKPSATKQQRRKLR